MPYAYARGDNCYGRGDYYRGDYYRGDPGLLGDIWKGVKKVGTSLVRGAVATVTGGPLAGLRAAAGGFAAPSIAPSSFGAGIPTFSGGGGGIGGLPGFGAEQIPWPTAPVGTMLPGGFVQMCGIKGTRPNKSSYYRAVRDPATGRPTGTALLIPKGSVCVRTRRLNVANPRALRRAIRRAQGFSKLARRVLTFVSAKAPRGRAKFKKKR